MDKEIKSGLIRAKQLADDREYQRARTAYTPGYSDIGWLDFFIEELDNMGIIIVKWPTSKFKLLLESEKVET